MEVRLLRKMYVKNCKGLTRIIHDCLPGGLAMGSGIILQGLKVAEAELPCYSKYPAGMWLARRALRYPDFAERAV